MNGSPIGLGLFLVGFLSFGCAVVYSLLSYRKTGEVFKGIKRTVFPWILLSATIAAAGMVVLYLTR